MSSILRLFREKVGRLTDQDTIDQHFCEVTVDENVIKKTQKLALRHRCSQRLGKGLFFTDKEKNETIAEMRKLILP
ncbi:MAG: hypothetical protein KAT52_08415 [Desulfobacterales bacterium]|nr:hypothetical protein [Desulfobacterales bacterium]